VVAGPATRLSKALQLAEKVRLDAAVLDLRLERVTTVELADRLMVARIPFLFQTSDPRAIPAAYHGVPVLRKPFRGGQLIAALHDLLAKA
jgi:CheY-like chemotaxis protein